MANQVTDLEIGEVSLVDKAAIGRKFLIFKADGSGEDEVKPAKNKGEPDSPLAKAAKAIVDRLLFEQENFRVQKEFVATFGCSWEEWKTLSKAEQERRQENFNARVQIEHLEGRLDELAAEIKRKDESHEQAYVRAMNSPEGEGVCRRLDAALALRR